MRAIIRALRASSALPTGKLQKIIPPIYQKAEFPTLLQQAPKKFKTLCTAEEDRVFREKEKTVKKPLVRLLVALGLLIACGSSSVMAEGPLPSCKPPLVCSVR
jgi:hypothetical protein